MTSIAPCCPAQSTICDDELGTITLPCLLPLGHEADGTWHDFGRGEGRCLTLAGEEGGGDR